uniref:CARD domain-containing protein n=1 Tax=Syphacia muris TaxID=451379 RepID=A0A0N5ADS2_9BILA
MATKSETIHSEISNEHFDRLDRLRICLANLNLKDLVPILVARRLLRSQEMGAVYSKEEQSEQVDELIEILKTKNHWVGPLIDALIRSGQGTLAKEILNVNDRSTQNTL